MYVTKQAESDSLPGRDRPALTPAMIEAGVMVLREAFGGQTEGQNRFVDFEEVVRRILSGRKCP